MPRQNFNVGRGTPTWGFNQFRSKGLPAFLVDLSVWEETGLEEEQCQLVRLTFQQIVDVVADTPNGSWLRNSVLADLEAFRDLYGQWNDGVEEPRTETFKKLGRQRKRISQKIRKNQYRLSEELDPELVTNLYGALGQLPQDLPQTFPNLSRAVRRFHLRL